MKSKFVEPRTLVELVRMFPNYVCDPLSFHRENTIGHGGFGDVWLGIDPHSGAQCAVKEMRIDHLQGVNLRRFIREVETMALCNTRFVVPIIGFAVDGPYYLITEYLSKGSLDHYIFNNKLSPTHLQIIAIGVALGMAHLHSKGIVHRDLKCSNILMDEKLLPRICDFGLAAFEDPTRDQHCQVGTTQYMAPEMFNHQPYTHKADVFSYAMLLYEMNEAHQPWPGADPDEVHTYVGMAAKRPDFSRNTPSDFRRLITKCWNQDPSKRPEFQEIADELISMKVCFSGLDKAKVSRVVSKLLEAEKTRAAASKPVPAAARIDAEDLIRRLQAAPPVPPLGDNSDADELEVQRSLASAGNSSSSLIRIGNLKIEVDHTKQGDLSSLTYMTAKKWAENVILVCEQLKENQFTQFYSIMKQNCLQSPPVDKILAILDSYILVHKHCPSFAKFLMDQKFFDQPIMEPPEAAKRTITLFGRVFLSLARSEKSSNLMSTLAPHFGNFLKAAPHEMLMIYQAWIHCCKPNLQEMAQLGDLFIVNNGLFLQSPNAEPFIQVFYFLLSHLPPYKKVRSSALVPIFTNFLRSCEPAVIEVALDALISLEETAQIQLPLILRLIPNQALHSHAMSYLLRQPRIPASSELIDLLVASSSLSKAPKLVLMRLAAESPDVLTINPGWLLKGCPTKADTVHVFLALVGEQENVKKAALIPTLPVFLKQLAESMDHFDLRLLSILMPQFAMDQSFMHSLKVVGFIRPFLVNALYDTDPVLLEGALRFLDAIGRIGYVKEYVEVLQAVVAALSKEGNVVAWAVTCLMTLSFYPDCAAKMKEMGLAQYFQSLMQYPAYQQYATVIVQNLSK